MQAVYMHVRYIYILQALRRSKPNKIKNVRKLNNVFFVCQVDLEGHSI